MKVLATPLRSKIQQIIQRIKEATMSFFVCTIVFN